MATVKRTGARKNKTQKVPEPDFQPEVAVWHDVSRLSDFDVHLFKEGTHTSMYEKFGSHCMEHKGRAGVYFAVWAPNARQVAVIGDFNGWNRTSHALAARWDGSGIWEGFIPGLQSGQVYKYFIESNSGYTVEKGDPVAFCWELAPQTASRIWDCRYEWHDEEWMRQRRERNSLNRPQSIYEVHLGSWRRVPEQGNRGLTYRELAEQLADYVTEMGFTHVELLPVMEHPFYGSWGYQSVGYFAPTSRFGSPQDFMYLIDRLHQRGIGVILDWVPSHFPEDQHGLSYFDGTHLYEHEDPRLGFHPDWKSAIFNYGRSEVRNFLASSALFWLEKYHVDGLRVDAVASMLYLDYSRKQGEWIPNQYGGRENIAAIEFLKFLNEAVYARFPDVQTYAEESTSWPMVSRPVHLGGLGFGLKWNMGWMHDTLSYFSKDSIHRKYEHNNLTFSIWYAFFENFVLCLSHDEVVHGKSSLLAKMPGDDWQKFANLRLLFGHMYMHPGKKLLFMGGEIGQWHEWDHDSSVDWHLLNWDPHRQLQAWVRFLNHMYRQEPALFERDTEMSGFRWVDCNDAEASIISYTRHSNNPEDMLLVICNCTPVPRHNYRVGVPSAGFWQEVLNSDAREYGGSGYGNLGGCEATPVASHGMYYSLSLGLPPLGIIVFKFQKQKG